MANKFAVWADEKYGFLYGNIEQAKDKIIVAYCQTIDEAKITWKFFYYK